MRYEDDPLPGALELTRKILDLVKDSDADLTDALCAIRAAEAMVPELGLRQRPTVVIKMPEMRESDMRQARRAAEFGQKLKDYA